MTTARYRLPTILAAMPRGGRPASLMLLAACLAVCGRAPAAALATTPTAAVAARVGFAGTYRTGSWTPLVIEYAAGARPPGAVRVWVEDPDGQFVRSLPAPVTAEGGGLPAARLTVRFGRPVGRVLVEAMDTVAPDTVAIDTAVEPVRAAFVRAAAERLLLPPPIPSTETVFLVLGDLPAADRAARLLARDDGARPRVVAIDPSTRDTSSREPLAGDPSSTTAATNTLAAVGAGGQASALGHSARDYDGADVIIICGRAAAALEPKVLAGIDGWVRQGGRLVFLAGATAAALDRAGSPAAGWLPGPVAKLLPLRRGAAIESFARSSRPLDRAALAAVEIPLLGNAREQTGSVEAFAGRGPADVPLVVRRAHGLGTVAWAGVELDQPPFRNWSGSDSMLVELLGGRSFTLARDGGRAGENQSGMLDLAGQLRRAVDRFAGVAPIPFEVVAGLGVLYVACLYPLDWWLTAGGRRRGWLAWLSLPAIVALSSGLVGAAGERWRGGGWRTNRAEIVDLDLETGLVRASSFAGVWSPENALIEVAVGTDPRSLALGQAVVGDVTWFAAGGRGIGATDAVSPHPSLAAADYASGTPAAAGAGDNAALAALVGVPIAASSSRLFAADVVGTLAAMPVTSSLARQAQGTLRGTVENRLPFPLEVCGLAHGGWYYDIGRLEPGGSFDTSVGRGPRSLAGALTRRTTNKDREIAVRWNPVAEDPARILEIAGFHVAAGGAGYTSLEPGRLARLDLSPLLPLDRAVLVGRGPALVDWSCVARPVAGGASLATPAVSGDASLWRIVIPLGAAPGAGRLDGGGDPADDPDAPRSPAAP